MKAIGRFAVCWIASLALCLPAATAGNDDNRILLAGEIVSMRINLLPGGAQLGFETEVSGDDPRVADLVAVIRSAEPGRGHKCANSGSIRFRMAGGSVVGVGLLPGHEEGLYEFRLYEDGEYVGVYRVDRDALLAALSALGVPLDERAFPGMT